ncbi:MAG: hypothetical protein M3O87_04100, partial [Candidatus Dormibacteraeota bacterium]|nr:hypothetical protein [Candidatus Dormibacteraeota bacterium]
FAVSAINGAAGEGPLSAAVLNQTIAPTTWTAMLHIAGAGPVAGNAVALTMKETPKPVDNTERVLQIPFGQRAGVVRWGPADWHGIDLPSISLPGGAAALRALIALLDQAQTGTRLYYRDVYGTMMAVSPAPGWQATLLPNQVQTPAVYRYINLHLDEVANPYQPSIAQGTALGFRGQTAGSITQLDRVESAA